MELDDEGVQALEAMREIVDDPASWVEFRIEKGQLQYLNNRQFAHSRTAFAGRGLRGRDVTCSASGIATRAPGISRVAP